jgi:hypothetical protein
VDLQHLAPPPIIVASAIGETSAYYWFLSITESALLLGIVWYAWTWPRRQGTP